MFIKKLLLQDIDHPSLNNWNKTKRRWAKITKKFPKNSEIQAAYEDLLKDKKIEKTIDNNLSISEYSDENNEKNKLFL